jgi:hypothetical protein
LKIDLLDSVISAAPGDTAVCRVRVLNDTAGPSAYRLRIVGLNGHELEYPLGYDAVPSGMEASFDVDIQVPREFAMGKHALAFEVVSDRRGELPALAGMTVEVGSIQQVAMQLNPSTIRGRGKARFSVQLDNREGRVVDVQLHGEGQNLRFEFARDMVRIRPGEVVAVPAVVRGPRRVVRAPINHVLTVVAESDSRPIYADAAFQQRPLIPSRFRYAMVVLALLGLWAGILGVGAYWYTHHNDKKTPTQLQTAAVVDANGDGIPDAPLGDGSAPGGAAAGGAAGGAAAGGAAGGADAKPKAVKPTSTVVGGTVKAGKTGQDAGITVSLTPALLGGETPTPAQAAAFARGGVIGGSPSDATAKIWPARYGRATSPGVSPERRTESVVTQLTDGKGAWVFPDVLIPDNYRLTFTKPGFETKSYIVTPPEDGKAVDLDVVLDTASGAAAGVVNGPNGPLGGVDIVVSDGKLTFTTKTSSEVGQIGTWSLAGLSTPNTYTLTATLRGFGTEVLQLPFDPGQQRSGIGITMTPGVGTISGHITAGADPLGAVTITASAGDLSRSTTSLTEGDAGAYLLPQLKIPGSYTMSVSAPGFVTQTRQLDLAGNAESVDFDLVRTTSTIVGLVTSNTNGPLPGVGITISKGELAFTSSTAVAPSAGTFRVEDVPPGEYLITFSRYDHGSTSQLVTLAAGEVRDLGTIMMTFQPRAALAQTGRLVVPVFDSGTTAIGGATVQVLAVSDNSIVFTSTDATGTQNTFAFDNVPIGTYAVRVTRPGYRTALRRVTIGLSEKQVEIHMLQLGQVSGIMVSSANASLQLKGYELKIYRLNSDGSRVTPELERITVLNSQAADADGNVLWESKPSSLIDGTYEIEVSQAPAGYAVAPQILQDGAPAMRFIVAPTDEGTIRLHEIKADPYASLSGTVTAPSQTATGIAFTPITSANLSLFCGGGPVQTTTVQESATAPGTFKFAFDSIQVQAATVLTPVCSVTVTATIPGATPADPPTPNPAYAPVTVALTSELKTTPGTNGGPVINIALVKIPAAIGGKVYWIDRGAANAKHPIGSITITTEGAVITGFSASETGSPTPIITSSPIAGSVNNGDWLLVGQVFGKATYVFNAGGANPAYSEGKLTVTIDETTRTVAAVSVEKATDIAGSIDAQLTPTNGVLSGTVQIDSVGTKQYGSVGITATAPGAPAPVTPAPVADGAGAFSIAAAPGTWNVRFTLPPHHIFAGGLAGPSVDVPAFVNPNAATTGINTHLIELASLQVTVLDTNNNPINAGTALVPITPTVTLERVAGPIPAGDPGIAAPTSFTLNATTGVGQRLDLPVNTVTPTDPNTAAQYVVHVTMSNYDNETAVITSPSGNTFSGTAAALAVPLVAGSKAQILIKLGKFGGIVGTARGVATGTAAFNEPLFSTPGGTVTAVREQYLDGTPVTTGVTAGTVAYDGVDLSKFTVTGPPGYYRITVVHPNFQAAASSPVDLDPTTPAGLYRMDVSDAAHPTSNTLSTDFVLPVKPGFVDVTASDGSALLSGDTVDIYAGHGANVDPVTGTPIASGTTDVNGHFVNDSTVVLNPGAYTVAVRSPLQQNFPVIVDVNVPRGNTAAARTTHLQATLAQIGGGISGNVAAFNSINTAGHEVPLPASIRIDRTYHSISANVDSLTVANQAADESFTTLTGGGTAAVPFSFTNLPRGVHTLQFSAAAGYTKPANADVTVVGVANTAVVPAFEYVATDATVDVVLTTTVPAAGTPVSDATVTLQLTGGPLITPTSFNAATGLYHFANVPPEVGTYRLLITHPLYLTIDQPLSVGINAGTINQPFTLVPSSAQILGTAYLQDTTAGPATRATGATVTLYNSLTVFNNTTQVGSPITPLGSTGDYVFSVSSPGNYTVQVTKSGYSTRTASLSGVVLGTAVRPATDIVIPKLASADVTVSPNTRGLRTTLTASAAPVSGSSPTVSGSCTGNPAVCSFDPLEPTVQYVLTFNATDYNTGTITYTPAIGEAATKAITLSQRNLTINVNTADVDSNDAKTATVTAVMDADPATTLTPVHTAGTKAYVFNPASLGTGTVTVSKTGYRTQTAAIPAGTTDLSIDVDLRGLASASGFVRLPSGTAVSSATVTATRISPSAVTKTATTGTGGSYSFTGLDTGTWQISAYKVGVGADTLDTNLTITPTSATTIPPLGDLTLVARTVSITGNVTFSGAAAVGATVVATRGGVTVTATSGAGGAYSISPVDVGVWTISAYQAGKGGFVSPTTVNITDLLPPGSPGTIVGPDLALVARSVTISGTITRPSSGGGNVNSTTVSATNMSTGAGADPVDITTDSTGAYSFSGLNVGSWVISAQKDGVGSIVSNPILVTASSGNVTTNLQLVAKNVTVSGTVRFNSSGAGAATVTLTNIFGDTFTDTTANDGTYSIANVQFGSWTVTAFKDNVGVGNGTTIQITASSPSGNTITGENITLVARSVTVTGLVTKGGTGTDGVNITALNAANSHSVTGISATVNSTAGTYTLTGLNVGTYSISGIKNFTGASSTPVTITITAATPNTGTTVSSALTLSPRSVPYTFHVIDSAGAVTGASVLVTGFAAVPSNGSGDAVVNFPEDALPASATTYSVTLAGYVTVNSTVGAPPATVAGTTIPVPTLVKVVVSGTISGGAGGGATTVISVCTNVADSPCLPASTSYSAAFSTTTTTTSYTLPTMPAGTYAITGAQTSPTKTGSTTATVANANVTANLTLG